uniref:Uncharacterized protein n=1 Tax=Cannabis sativa TaxID=3483 RepID=A0A803PSJ9_CANSA
MRFDIIASRTEGPSFGVNGALAVEEVYPGSGHAPDMDEDVPLSRIARVYRRERGPSTSAWLSGGKGKVTIKDLDDSSSEDDDMSSRLRGLAGGPSEEPLGRPRAKVVWTLVLMKMSFLHGNSKGSSSALWEQIKTLDADLLAKGKALADTEALGMFTSAAKEACKPFSVILQYYFSLLDFRGLCNESKFSTMESFSIVPVDGLSGQVTTKPIPSTDFDVEVHRDRLVVSFYHYGIKKQLENIESEFESPSNLQKK